LAFTQLAEPTAGIGDPHGTALTCHAVAKLPSGFAG